MKNWIEKVDRVVVRKGNLKNYSPVSKLGRGAQGVVGKIRKNKKKSSKPLNENLNIDSQTEKGLDGCDGPYDSNKMYALKVIAKDGISRQDQLD